jgi:hypothetical protein
VPAALGVNRALIASLLVLALAGISLALSAGGFGVTAAAGAVPGQVPTPIESEPPGSESEPPATTTPDGSAPASGSPAGSGPAESTRPEPSFQSVPSP